MIVHMIVYFGKNVSTASLLPKCSVSMSVEYDANGNLIYVNTAREKKDGTKTDKNSERKLLWDEENRLEAIDDNGFVSNYWYDAAGERTVKTSGDAEQMYVNGLFSGGNTETAKFTAYVNAYMVVSKGGNYTKHIYIGNQRIVSKLGDLDSYGADPRRIEYAGANVDGANVQYTNKYTALQQTIKDRYAAFEVEYYGKDNDDYVNGQGFCCDDTPQNAPARVPSSNDNPELFQYYYHSDHLGSTSLITNLDGEVVQHIEYVPFGEVFIEERNNRWNTPYLFNAKELDEETGLYYYGARYYDPRVSLWLSADPMQEKYQGVSTYAYCLQNPIMFIDPDGNEIYIGKDRAVYSYVPNRDYSSISNEFDRNTYMSLDQLHSTGAMNITFGTGETAKTINVLTPFMENTEHNLSIIEGSSNNYSPSTNTIKFNSTQGAEFRKDLEKGWEDSNVGRNSASALLGHEIIHGYNDEFDNTNYISRKDTKYSSTTAPFFPNEEEQSVTTNWANQILKVLGQDERTHYQRNYYNTESSTTTTPKTE
ncbi:hypothetical protein FACS1894180_7040 [Bacteroidia bacterium]|nr:hypothetical protein FACS1894180_7040 [Bacteroidia bacterium]